MFKSTARPKQVIVRATVTKADGRVIDHGVIARWHRNPLVRALWRLRGLAVSPAPRMTN